MKKIFLFIMLMVSFVMRESSSKEYEDIKSSFDNSVQVEVIIDGNSSLFSKGTFEYECILFEFNKILYGSHEVPSLGVSLDDLTKKEKETGVWLEFNFKEVSYSNEMPFEALLVKVSLDYGGFNVIRKYQGKYEGRTYYINLVNNMDELYFYLLRNYS